ncbi:MAG: GYD domain-containing protein [Bryobacterales bacterium]
MPKFMGVAQYSSEGLSGLMEDGAAKRQRDVKAAIKTIGGKLEAFYFSLGNDDCIFIVDLPDTPSAAALSILAGASGVVPSKRLHCSPWRKPTPPSRRPKARATGLPAARNRRAQKACKRLRGLVRCGIVCG